MSHGSRHWLTTRRLIPVAAMLSLGLSSCGSSRYVNLPGDRRGQGVNSLAEELSPQVNGQLLVFTSDRRDAQGIYLYNLRTRRLEPLPRLNALNQVASHPGITADGRYVVYALSRNGDQDIYLYDRETEQNRNLTAGLNADTRNPVISANGEQIAFEVAEQGQWDIRVVDRQGKALMPGF